MPPSGPPAPPAPGPGPVDGAGPPPLGRAGALLLVLLTLGGAGLRLLRLGDEPLWLDEATTAAFAARPLAEAARAEIQHPPLHTLLTWAAVRGAPASDGAAPDGTAAEVARAARASSTRVRLPALLAGVLLVPALALLVRRLAPRAHARRAALGAALLAALAPFGVYLSQEARNYSLYMLLAVVSTTLVLPLLGPAGASRPRTSRLALYALVSLLLMLTHHLGALVLLAHEGLYLTRLVACRRAGVAPAVPLRAWLLARALAAAAFLPWGLHVVARVTSGAEPLQARHWVGAPEERIPYSLLRDLLGYGLAPEDAEAGALPRAEVLAREAPRAVLLLLPLLALLALGLRARAWRSTAERRAVLLLLLLPYALLLPLSPWMKMIHERYLAFQAPLLWAVLALALAALRGRARWGGAAAALLPLLAGLLAQQPAVRAAVGLPGAYGKEAWDEAARFVRAQAPQHLVLAPGYLHLAFDRAWLQTAPGPGSAPAVPPPRRWAWPAASGGPEGRDGDALPALGPGERAAVVLSHLAEDEPRLRSLLAGWRVVAEGWWPAQSGVRVLVLQAPQ